MDMLSIDDVAVAARTMETAMERKSFRLKQVDTVGRMVEGYAATWDKDVVGDRITQGAFAKTIAERGPTGSGTSQIKVLYQHYYPVGLPVEMREDAKGLWVKMKIAQTPLGDEVLRLIEERVIDRMSIGFDVILWEYDEDNETRTLKELRLYEVSFVTFPANEDAIVLGIKDARKRLTNMFQKALAGDGAEEFRQEMAAMLKSDSGPNGVTKADMEDFVLGLFDPQETKAWVVGGSDSLSLGDEDRSWDGGAARRRVRAWATNDDGEVDFGRYRQAFVVYDDDAEENLTSYRLPFADVIGDTLTAIPRGIFAAAGVLQGARGGIDIPETAILAAKDFLDPYYEQMGRTPPWAEEEESKAMDKPETTTAENPSEAPPEVADEEKCAEEVQEASTAVLEAETAQTVEGEEVKSSEIEKEKSEEASEEKSMGILETLLEALTNTHAGSTVEEKAGAVLSKRNKELVEKARDALSALLEAASRTEREKPEKSTSPEEQVEEVKGTEVPAATAEETDDAETSGTEKPPEKKSDPAEIQSLLKRLDAFGQKLG